jgi:hypothetical protein
VDAVVLINDAGLAGVTGLSARTTIRIGDDIGLAAVALVAVAIRPAAIARELSALAGYATVSRIRRRVLAHGGTLVSAGPAIETVAREVDAPETAAVSLPGRTSTVMVRAYLRRPIGIVGALGSAGSAVVGIVCDVELTSVVHDSVAVLEVVQGRLEVDALALALPLNAMRFHLQSEEVLRTDIPAFTAVVAVGEEIAPAFVAGCSVLIGACLVRIGA